MLASAYAAHVVRKALPCCRNASSQLSMSPLGQAGQEGAASPHRAGPALALQSTHERSSLVQQRQVALLALEGQLAQLEDKPLDLTSF